MPNTLNVTHDAAYCRRYAVLPAEGGEALAEIVHGKDSTGGVSNWLNVQLAGEREKILVWLTRGQGKDVTAADLETVVAVVGMNLDALHRLQVDSKRQSPILSVAAPGKYLHESYVPGRRSHTWQAERTDTGLWFGGVDMKELGDDEAIVRLAGDLRAAMEGRLNRPGPVSEEPGPAARLVAQPVA